MRYQAVYVPGQGLVAEYENGELVWSKGQDIAKTPSIQVIKDLEPHRNMQTGEIVSTRRRHREILRDYNLVEIGNEKMESRPNPVSRSTRRETISRMLGDMSDRQANQLIQQAIKDYRR